MLGRVLHLLMRIVGLRPAERALEKALRRPLSPEGEAVYQRHLAERRAAKKKP